MTNMNLYSRGDKMFVILNMVLIGLFTLSTLYPFPTHPQHLPTHDARSSFLTG